jgi:hypothetical protein
MIRINPSLPAGHAPSPHHAASAKNLKQIGLALHNYHDTFLTFPAAAILSKDGKPLLSWRVAILPYVEEDNLYRQFRLDEPWDSEHNKKLLGKMPRIYAPPGVKPKAENTTFYQAFVGKGTAFEGTQGTRIADFIDGTSNTILVVEAGEAVPWTRPDDLPYADGSVRFARKGFAEKVFRLAITRGDGQVLDFDKIPAGNYPRLIAVQQELVPALIGAMQDADGEVRKHARAAVVHLGALAVAPLLNRLRGKDKELRLGAAVALGEIGGAAQSALPDLTRLLKDPDKDLRRAAALAIGLLVKSPDASRQSPWMPLPPGH